MQKTLDLGGIGVIVGSPGSGKSTTSLAFSTTINTNEWVVTWIRLSRNVDPLCCRIVNGRKVFSILPIDRIASVLSGNQKHVVFLDGYVQSLSEHGDVHRLCIRWHQSNTTMNRLFVVTSMTSRGKVKPHEDAQIKLKEHFVESWLLKDYLAAVRYDKFYENVQSHLLVEDSNGNRLSRIEKVEKKFFYAGGCSRFMFGLSVEDVYNRILSVLDDSSNVELLLEGLRGDASQHLAVNSLICSYLYEEPFCGKTMLLRRTLIASRFALNRLVAKCGREVFNHLLNAIRVDVNPSMRGWLYEHWFFATLQKNDVSYIMGHETFSWESSVVRIVDPNQIQTLPENANGIFWYWPIIWNQGGYDGFYYDTKSKELVALQLFTGKSHDLKLCHFNNLALNKAKVLGEISRLRILFVVLNEEARQVGTVVFDTAIRQFGWNERNVRVKVEFCILN